MAEQNYQPFPDSPREANDAGQEKSLEELLAEAHAKIEQQREAMLRAVAEADNIRKRTQAEAANAQKYALERFADALLPALDSLEAAVNTSAGTVESLRSGVESLRSGVELTLKQLKTALERGKITEINPAPGERFDPHRHQAMAALPSEAEPNSIISVMQKGYALHDRVLRPALVTVAKALEKDAGNPMSDTDLD